MEEKRKLQIHIAGCKRSGKTTLAKGLIAVLGKKDYKPFLFDPDIIKIQIFGAQAVRANLPDSEESLKMQRLAVTVLFKVALPLVLEAGGTPVVVFGHSNPEYYEEAKRIAEQFGTSLKFFLLESPTLEEVRKRMERNPSDPSDMSDMKDFNNPEIAESFRGSVERIQGTYTGLTGPFRIKQGKKSQMLNEVLRYILR